MTLLLSKKTLFGIGFSALAAFALAMLLAAPTAQAAPLRQTDTAVASEGCVLVMASGEFSADKQAALSRINAIRYEACVEGVENPATGKPLTKGDYVPIKWSTDLEEIAQIRAAEGCLSFSHTRPNEQGWFSVYSNDIGSQAECIASVPGLKDSVNLWYGEKKTWVNGGSGETGHYTCMIDPRYAYVGVGGFASGTNGCGAAEFSSAGNLSEGFNNVSGAYNQVVETPRSGLKGFALSSAILVKGKTVSLRLSASYNDCTVYALDSKLVKSSNPKVIKIKSDVTAKAAKYGKSKVTVSSTSLGKTVSKTLKVGPTPSKLIKAKYVNSGVCVKWKKVKGISGYQIAYMNWGSSKWTKVKVSKSKVKTTLKGFCGGFCKIRTYKKSGGKVYYSDWS